ncbi:hypothetical protein QDA04_gp70 [Microbacterium phage Megan]|uniref:Uncharacterized protein n=1 Tax=Microbacterium phage Megan TaxID=2656551 RepID=A0A649VK23_9CAUD|nr:hypothetical protein QDA04_gp70 [Microbacterium phage Megan]QGJ92740.1 hypothetical protein PBI_MEGAN_70 [Microbacterium phage Megan]
MPTDVNIIAVALRRMAVLSDEPKEVRERAEQLADLFDALDTGADDE